MKTKYISIISLITAAILMGTLTGCGSDSSSPTPTESTSTTLMSIGDLTDAAVILDTTQEGKIVPLNLNNNSINTTFGSIEQIINTNGAKKIEPSETIKTLVVENSTVPCYFSGTKTANVIVDSDSEYQVEFTFNECVDTEENYLSFIKDLDLEESPLASDILPIYFNGDLPIVYKAYLNGSIGVQYKDVNGDSIADYSKLYTSSNNGFTGELKSLDDGKFNIKLSLSSNSDLEVDKTVDNIEKIVAKGILSINGNYMENDETKSFGDLKVDFDDFSMSIDNDKYVSANGGYNVNGYLDIGALERELGEMLVENNQVDYSMLGMMYHNLQMVPDDNKVTVSGSVDVLSNGKTFSYNGQYSIVDGNRSGTIDITEKTTGQNDMLKGTIEYNNTPSGIIVKGDGEKVYETISQAKNNSPYIAAIKQLIAKSIKNTKLEPTKQVITNDNVLPIVAEFATFEYKLKKMFIPLSENHIVSYVTPYLSFDFYNNSINTESLNNRKNIKPHVKKHIETQIIKNDNDINSQDINNSGNNYKTIYECDNGYVQYEHTESKNSVENENITNIKDQLILKNCSIYSDKNIIGKLGKLMGKFGLFSTVNDKTETLYLNGEVNINTNISSMNDRSKYIKDINVDWNNVTYIAKNPYNMIFSQFVNLSYNVNRLSEYNKQDNISNKRREYSVNVNYGNAKSYVIFKDNDNNSHVMASSETKFYNNFTLNRKDYGEYEEIDNGDKYNGYDTLTANGRVIMNVYYNKNAIDKYKNLFSDSEIDSLLKRIDQPIEKVDRVFDFNFKNAEYKTSYNEQYQEDDEESYNYVSKTIDSYSGSFDPTCNGTNTLIEIQGSMIDNYSDNNGNEVETYNGSYTIIGKNNKITINTNSEGSQYNIIATTGFNETYSEDDLDNMLSQKLCIDPFYYYRFYK